MQKGVWEPLFYRLVTNKSSSVKDGSVKADAIKLVQSISRIVRFYEIHYKIMEKDWKPQIPG